MPPIDFDRWIQKSDAVRIFLVETSAMRIADGFLLPLYFATHTVILDERCYLGTQIGLPRLSSPANPILSPNHVSTWGELELDIEPNYRPDAFSSVTWLELLSPAWNLRDQPLIILMGGEGFAYGDFRQVFTGRVGQYNWVDNKLTLAIYDKTKSLEITIPDYELPESVQVVEESWDQTVPAILGRVKNYKPILITTTNPGIYPWKYALACHVCHALDAVNGDNAPISHGWAPKDVFPARKDGEGSAGMYTFGPYTGSLIRAEWIIQIDSITALNSQGSSGPEVGLATYRWKLGGDADWRGEGILTWKLAYDSTTLVKSPSVSHGVMAVSGIYTGDCKLAYKAKVTRSGDIGDPVPPQFIWSDDGGVTWKPDDVCTWTPIAAAPGVMSVAAHNPGDSVRVEITTGGNVGGAVRFKWSQDGGATWDTNNQIPNTSPIELFPGYSIQFTAPGVPGVNDYDAGDAGSSTSAINIAAAPIVLNRGLSVTFSGAGHMEPTWTWTPIGAATGVCSVTEGDPQDVFIIITLSGPCMAATFDWQIGINSGSGVTHPFAQEIYPGYRVAFTDPAGLDDYEVGDQSVLGSYYAPAFIVNDTWAFSFKEIPIPLADGVTIQFLTQAGQDFYRWDEWSFILGSTLLLAEVGSGVNITVDVRGLISPALGAYTHLIGEMIRAALVLWGKWNAVADFDLPALAAFNVAFPYEAGLMVDSPTALADITDQLLTGLPALYAVKNDGRFFLAEIAPLTGEPILELTDVEFLQSPEGADGDDDLYRRVYLHYDRNPEADKNPQGAPSQERVEWLRREFRQVSARDEAVLVNYPWATDLGPLDTCLVHRADAQALANKVLDLVKVKHPKVTVLIKHQSFHLNLGDKIKVRRSSFGIATGQIFEIHGAELNFTTSEAILSLWR
ncbi:MAG: hypothetical protein FJ121_09005 [Deltaproteobacteria bacterium]|nr:hypothetical protein [Deltaproteobacteria bacterium]